MPELFQVFLKANERFRKNPRRAMRAADTTIRRAREDVMRDLEARTAADPNWLLRSLRELADLVDALGPLEESVVRRRLAEERAKICEDPMAARVLSLLDRAHANYRGSPFLVQPNPVAFAHAGMRSTQALLRLDGVKRGEARASLALTAYGDVCEAVYDTYLTKLWSLWHLAEGDLDNLRPPKRFGDVVRHLSKKIADPLAVDADAAHIRNARFHSHFFYDAKLDALELWDANGWTATLRVDDLIERACVLHIVSSEAFPAAFGHFIQEVLVDLMMPALVVFPKLLREQLTTTERDELSREYKAREAGLFGAIPVALADLRGRGEDPRLAKLSGLEG